MSNSVAIMVFLTWIHTAFVSVYYEVGQSYLERLVVGAGIHSNHAVATPYPVYLKPTD